MHEDPTAKTGFAVFSHSSYFAFCYKAQSQTTLIVYLVLLNIFAVTILCSQILKTRKTSVTAALRSNSVVFISMILSRTGLYYCLVKYFLNINDCHKIKNGALDQYGAEPSEQ